MASPERHQMGCRRGTVNMSEFGTHCVSFAITICFRKLHKWGPWKAWVSDRVSAQSRCVFEPWKGKKIWEPKGSVTDSCFSWLSFVQVKKIHCYDKRAWTVELLLDTRYVTHWRMPAFVVKGEVKFQFEGREFPSLCPQLRTQEDFVVHKHSLEIISLFRTVL